MFRKLSESVVLNFLKQGKLSSLSVVPGKFLHSLSKENHSFKLPLIAFQTVNSIKEPVRQHLNIISPGKLPLAGDPQRLPLDNILDEVVYDSNREINDPCKVIEKQAARLMVIRRRKMKRHRLKKLRIKMKFEWAKVRQKREMKKEKDFQAELLGQIKEAKKFDPQAYASEKIGKANEVLIPKLWKGKRLPEFVIKELLVKKRLRIKELNDRIERRKNMDVNVSNYKF